MREWGSEDFQGGNVPLRLELLECLSLGVVADDFGIDEAAQVELFTAELRHRVDKLATK